MAPKFGATGRELIFEEENFSGNLQDLIQNLHTLNMLASNITHNDKPNLKKDNITDTDKGRSIEEDFVFNDVALESVDNIEDYKDDLDPIYGLDGLDDPNYNIGVDDVIASVTIRVDDDEEGRTKDDNKDETKLDTTKEMTAEVEGNAGEGLLKKNETEKKKKGKWVWRRRRESGKIKRKANRLVENHIGQKIVGDSVIPNKEIEGKTIDRHGRENRGEEVEEKWEGEKGKVRREESERAKVKVQREEKGERQGRQMGDGRDGEGRGEEKGQEEGRRGGSERAQRGNKREGREIMEKEIQHQEHGHEVKSEEVQREIQREEGGFGKKQERVRRQVLDAVLVPCKTGQLCIISGQFIGKNDVHSNY